MTSLTLDRIAPAPLNSWIRLPSLRRRWGEDKAGSDPTEFDFLFCTAGFSRQVLKHLAHKEKQKMPAEAGGTEVWD